MQVTRPVTKPSKQRKKIFQAPDHIRHKLFAAHLSPELAASQGIKSLPIRSGDTVRIMRGDHKGFSGKVTRVDREKYRIFVEGLTRERVDGTAVPVAIHPSKATITNLSLEDKRRKASIERKKKARKKPEEVERRAPKKPRKVVKPKEEAVIEKAAAVAEEKPKRRRRAARKPAEKKAEAEVAVEEIEKEKKPKQRRTRPEPKTAEEKAGVE